MLASRTPTTCIKKIKKPRKDKTVSSKTDLNYHTLFSEYTFEFIKSNNKNRYTYSMCIQIIGSQDLDNLSFILFYYKYS